MAYKAKDKKSIQQALDIIKLREKQKETNPFTKASVHTVLEQKKEMFLVTMAHGIIDDEV